MGTRSTLPIRAINSSALVAMKKATGIKNMDRKTSCLKASSFRKAILKPEIEYPKALINLFIPVFPLKGLSISGLTC